MAIINVDDAYILNETGAQVDKTTGIPFKNESLTEAEAAQARANIRAGGSNPNLLDNAYFVGGGSQLGDGHFPINQRGQTSYAGGATTAIDRWWQQYDATVTLISAGLRLTGKWNISQRLPSLLPNGTYTFSVDIVTLNSAGVTIFFIDQNDQIVAGATKVIDSTGITSLTITSDQIKGVTINLTNPSGTGDITIASAKLELGTVSTLANDPVPDFGAELAKCQRYLYIPTFPWYAWTGTLAMATSATDFNWVINTPVPMRQGVIPTIGITGSVYINNTAVSNLTIGNYPVGNLVKISGTSAGMTSGQLYPVNTSADNVSVILSAEI